jgi:hypothetical protein
MDIRFLDTDILRGEYLGVLERRGSRNEGLLLPCEEADLHWILRARVESSPTQEKRGAAMTDADPRVQALAESVNSERGRSGPQRTMAPASRVEAVRRRDRGSSVVPDQWGCAWCGPPVGSCDAGQPGRVNYGICRRCLERCLSELHERRVRAVEPSRRSESHRVA